MQTIQIDTTPLDAAMRRIDERLDRIEGLIEKINKAEPAKHVRGNEALAEELKVSLSTVNKWKREGKLDAAVVLEEGRVIVYDTAMAREAIGGKQGPVKAGRPRINR